MNKETTKRKNTTTNRKSVAPKETSIQAATAKKTIKVKQTSEQTAVAEKITEIKKPPKQRSWRVAFFLSLFLGFLGADRFYIGRTRSAIVKLVTLSCFGVWWLTDFILIASDWRKDADGQPLKH